MSVMSVYEKMIKEGKLNTPIKLEQPSPDNPSGKQFGSSGNYNAGIKNIVNEKIEVEKPSSSDLSELNKLKERVKFLEESLKIIMDQHIKIMNR